MILKLLFLFTFSLANGVTDTYFCRFRVSEVPVNVADQVRDPQFLVQYELSTGSNAVLVRKGTDVGEDNSTAEVLDKIEKPGNAQVAAVNYPNLGPLASNKVSIRCSKANISAHDRFTESYLLKLGTASTVAGNRVRRAVTWERQSRMDCHMNGGYVHPNSLDSIDRYVADGEEFVIGCSMSGSCENGGMSAVSRCPPSIAGSTYQEVRKVGECCEDYIEKATVEAKGCPKNEDGIAFKFPDANQGASKYRPVIVPWQVRFAHKKDGKKCDGVIINKLWFLTTKSCLTDKSDIEFLRPESIKNRPPAHPKNITIVQVKTVADNDTTVDLALAKISAPFASGDWTTALQPVTLPWSQAACTQFLAATCHVLLGTEQRHENDSNVVIAVSAGPNRPATPTYLQPIQKREQWPVVLGSGAVSWFGKANFLVGVYVGRGGAATGAWKDDTNQGNLISVCPFLDAIKQKITN